MKLLPILIAALVLAASCQTVAPVEPPFSADSGPSEGLRTSITNLSAEQLYALLGANLAELPAWFLAKDGGVTVTEQEFRRGVPQPAVNTVYSWKAGQFVAAGFRLDSRPETPSQVTITFFGFHSDPSERSGFNFTELIPHRLTPPAKAGYMGTSGGPDFLRSMDTGILVVGTSEPQDDHPWFWEFDDPAQITTDPRFAQLERAYIVSVRRNE